MTLREAVSVMDVLVESGDDRERAAWEKIRQYVNASELLSGRSSMRLDRVAWGDGNAEHDE